MPLRRGGDRRHTDRHRTAVADARVIQMLFKCVAERMPEIEQLALPAFALVVFDHTAFHKHTPPHDLRQQSGRKRLIPFEKSKQLFVTDARGFNHLAHTVGHVFLRQRRQRIDIGDDADRLPECSDEIFALRDIDTCLAADGGIHLREKRRRDLHKIDAAHPRRGGKARHIARHTAAERHHKVTAIKLRRRERSVKMRDSFQPLVLFACGEGQHADRLILRLDQAVPHRVGIQRRHVAVAYDQHT